MHLFSRDWHSNEYLPLGELLVCLAVYTPLAAGVAGLTVPMGAFIPCMYMGSLIGRIFGVSLNSSLTNLGPAGVYAILGSAAVLAGFTHMTMAITVLLLEVTHDLTLIGPLMLCISIARAISQVINHHGYDEQLILLKKVPFLDEDPPENLDDLVAIDLCEKFHSDALLSPAMSKPDIEKALAVAPGLEQFPVLSKCGAICIGIIPRSRLECIIGVRSMTRRMSVSSFSDSFSDLSSGSSFDMGDFRADERSSPKRGPLLEVGGLMDQTPHTAFEDMPISRLYPLFAQVGVSSVCIVSHHGVFKGIITRNELMQANDTKKVRPPQHVKEHERDFEEPKWIRKLRQQEALKSRNGSESYWVKKWKAAEDENRVLMDEAKGFIAEIEALKEQLHKAEEHQGPLPINTPCTTGDSPQID
jgi:chloride channel 7